GQMSTSEHTRAGSFMVPSCRGCRCEAQAALRTIERQSVNKDLSGGERCRPVRPYKASYNSGAQGVRTDGCREASGLRAFRHNVHVECVPANLSSIDEKLDGEFRATEWCVDEIVDSRSRCPQLGLAREKRE